MDDVRALLVARPGDVVLLNSWNCASSQDKRRKHSLSPRTVEGELARQHVLMRRGPGPGTGRGVTPHRGEPTQNWGNTCLYFR